MKYLKYIVAAIFLIFPVVVFAATVKPDALEFQKKVENYYSLISYQKLDEAFAMKDDPKITLDKFKKLYKDPIAATTSNFKKIRKNVYGFEVRVIPKDYKKTIEFYDIVMELRNGKLRTLSTKKIIHRVEERVKFNNSLKASIEWDDGIYKVFINKNGNKKLIVKLKATESEQYQSYSNLKFSKKGLYLTFEKNGWEWSGVNIYDIKNQKLSNDFYGSGLYGFTAKEDYFYLCNESGISGGELFVMKMQGFIKKHLYGGEQSEEKEALTECGPFDSKRNIIHYKKGDLGGDNKPYEYSIYK